MSKANSKHSRTVLTISGAEKRMVAASGTAEGFSALSGIAALLAPSQILTGVSTAAEMGSIISAIFVLGLGYSLVYRLPTNVSEEGRNCMKINRALFVLMNLAADQLSVLERLNPTDLPHPEFALKIVLQIEENKRQGKTSQFSERLNTFADAYTKFMQCVDNIRIAIYGDGNVSALKHQQNFVQMIVEYDQHRQSVENAAERELWRLLAKEYHYEDEAKGFVENDGKKTENNLRFCSENKFNNWFVERYDEADIDFYFASQNRRNFKEFKLALQEFKKEITSTAQEQRGVTSRARDTHGGFLRDVLESVRAIESIEPARMSCEHPALKAAYEVARVCSGNFSDDIVDYALVSEKAAHFSDAIQTMRQANRAQLFWKQIKPFERSLQIFGKDGVCGKSPGTFSQFLQQQQLELLMTRRGDKLTRGAFVGTVLWEAGALGTGGKVILMYLLQKELLSFSDPTSIGIIIVSIVVILVLAWFGAKAYEKSVKYHNARLARLESLKQQLAKTEMLLFSQSKIGIMKIDDKLHESSSVKLSEIIESAEKNGWNVVFYQQRRRKVENGQGDHKVIDVRGLPAAAAYPLLPMASLHSG